MRLSSEMFPFASHDEYGYRLAPFASHVLAELGEVAAGLGHRLTTHPGQVSCISPETWTLTCLLTLNSHSSRSLGHPGWKW